MDGGDIKYVDSATGNFSGEQSCCNVTPDTETEGGESGARGMRKQESRREREREEGNGSWLVLGRQLAAPDSLVVRVQPFVRRIIMGKASNTPLAPKHELSLRKRRRVWN